MKTLRPTVSIVDCGSNKVTTLARCIDDLGAQASVISPAQLISLGQHPPDAILISGNPALISDTGTAFLEDFKPLLELDVPVLGICFGHQVIGLLHDAEVSIGKEDRELRCIEVVRTHDLFRSLAGNCRFQEDHTEEVSLPAQFTLLATSSHCGNEAMAHATESFYGVQFHPESSGEAGTHLLANFLSLALPA